MNLAPRDFLTKLFDAAVAAAQAERCVVQWLPGVPPGRTVVVGAGKAAAAMARSVESRWDGPLAGVVATRRGYALPCARIEVIEAAHPVPDAASRTAAGRMFDAVRWLGADDLVIGLISGGGSSLLALPASGIELDDIRSITAQLLRAGANIAEMNCVRRHLSGIKGGRLAAACAPARVVNLLISDVPGDVPCDIASGPTVGDPTTCADALAALDRYQVDVPANARRVLESGAGESVKPDDPRLAGAATHLVATPRMALAAAAGAARAAGIMPLVLGDRIEGEAREVGKVLAGIALAVRAHGQPLPPPCVLLSGGEATVTVRGDGCGGPNVECALAMAIALDGASGIHAVLADTDGVDGAAEIAGACIGPATLQRARAAGLDARAMLQENDAHTFFERVGDSLVTGPTFTNVNDFRAVLIL